MKKYIVLILVALTIVGAYFFRPTKSTPPPKNLPHKAVSENRKLFLGKRKNVVAAAPVSTGCDNLLLKLNDLDLSDDLPEEMYNLSFEGCEIDRIKSVKEACDKKIKLCMTELVFLRSILRTRGIETSTDKETVADLIISEFAKNPPNFQKLEKLVKELLDQNPENQTYQKLWAMNKLMSNIHKKPLPKNLKDTIYGRLDPEILTDPDLMSYRLFLETEMNPLKAEDFARSLLRQYPDKPDAYEALGWSLWQQNRRAEALVQLDKAIRLNPKDLWLKEMYKQAQAPNAPLNAYKGRLNIGVQLEDLYQ